MKCLQLAKRRILYLSSVTAANIVEGQLDEKEVDIPINYYAIQALNTGEGSTAAERAAKAGRSM